MARATRRRKDGSPITRDDCRGCHDEHYHAEPGGCWQFAGATIVNWLDVPRGQAPPYHMKAVPRPRCWLTLGVCRVNPSALDSDGFWEGILR